MPECNAFLAIRTRAMNDLNLTPENELERNIQAAHAGQMDEDTFMRYLWNAPVFMPVNESISAADAQDADSATPLLMPAADGTRVVLLFSSAARAKPILAQMPGVNGGFEARFGWVVEKINQGMPDDAKYGVSLNPGWDLCLDFYADLLNGFTAE